MLSWVEHEKSCIILGPVEALSFKHIGLDKSGYQVNIFLISPQKHMLLVLTEALLMSTTTNVFVEK